MTHGSVQLQRPLDVFVQQANVCPVGTSVPPEPSFSDAAHASDNLRTNHRGVFVLHDNEPKPLLRFSTSLLMNEEQAASDKALTVRGATFCTSEPSAHKALACIATAYV